MGVQERRAREKEELRQEILEAARELFIQEGYDNVSMRKIAERIEYSPTTIYLYFQDKADLFDCIVEEALLKLDEKLLALAIPSDPLADLKVGLRAYIEFWVQHPQPFRLAYMTDLRSIDANRQWRFQPVAQKLFGRLRTSLEACRSAGVLEFDDIEAQSQAVWAPIYGLACLLITKPHFPWVDQAKLIDLVVNSAVQAMIPVPMAV
jgi:AcrR family transcriptional regulator